MTFRVLRTIPTPWAPYAVMFSRDGTRLAIGGGAWYGDGGILVVDLSSGNAELFRCVELQRDTEDWVPTVSGVCFSDDDQHLAASTWRARHHYSPTLLFEVSELKLTHRATLPHLIADPWACPTGVLLSGDYTVTRHHKAAPNEVLAVCESPRELGIKAVNITQHFTSSHLVVVGANAITAGRGLPPLPPDHEYEDYWRTLIAFRESGGAIDEGLVSVALAREAPRPQLIPVQACRQVTAIAATPDGNGFVTGGLEGELDMWSWKGRWRQERLREWTRESKSVIGICYLPLACGWVSISHDGQFDVIAGKTSVGSWRLPTAGSPRSLAAHPTRNWIAVGTKQRGEPHPGGVVDLIEIEMPSAPA